MQARSLAEYRDAMECMRDQARAQLANAQPANRHVAEYLANPGLWHAISDCYSPGQESAAAWYARELGIDWYRTPGAIVWLVQQCDKEPLCKRDGETLHRSSFCIALTFPLGKLFVRCSLDMRIYSRTGIMDLKSAAIEPKFPYGNMDSISLGLLVRRERKAQNLKQAELAAVSGVGVRLIVDLEAGKPTLQLGKVLQVITTLGCEVQIALPASRS